MEQIKHRAAPPGELGHEDHIDLAGLGESQDFFSLGAVVLGAGGGFLPNGGDLVARLLGDGAQFPLLAGASLIGGRYPTVRRGGFSQLNPLGAAGVKAANFAAFLSLSIALFKVYFNWDSRVIGGVPEFNVPRNSALLVSAQELLPWYLRLSTDGSKRRAL